MFKNYLKIALRRLSRERFYVLVNIFSLALGIASFLILALYLRSEVTYDRHHVNHERIYRILARSSRADQVKNFAVSQLGIGPLLVQDYPQLGTYVRFFPSSSGALRYNDTTKIWDHVYLADPSVFKVFTHKILYGDPAHAFDEPFSIAISETMSRLYFGDDNPIGKQLIGATFPLKVTLVFADLPENTHLKYNALIPITILEKYNPDFVKNLQNTLWNVGNYSYLMVPADFKRTDFDKLSSEFYDRHMKELGDRMKTVMKPDLQPLTEQHFGEKLEGDELEGNIFYVYGFAAVAIFILLVGCINYVNLATARATKRAKEVGMRKVLGASHSQLIGQFLGESLTFTAIALIVALILIELALSLTPIGTLMGKEHLLAALKEPIVWIGVLVLGGLVALIAGLYPAFYLSSISPLAALTQVKRSWRTGFSLRQILVFVQLSISIGVIACTILMTNQMRYVHNIPLGFDKENRLLVTLRRYEVIKNLKTIKNELRVTQGVVDVSTIVQVPGTGNYVNLVSVESEAGTMEPSGIDRIIAGTNIVNAMKLKIIDGRGFSDDIATDVKEAVLVNESFAKKHGWTKSLGKRVQGGPYTAHVIGVVQDFHYASLHNEIGPLMIQPLNESYDQVPEMQKPLLTTSLVVVLSGNDIHATLDRVHRVIAKFDPTFIFEPTFLEDKLNDLYRTEISLMKLTGTFAAICIFISVMGLFGLAAFTTEQRTKEIGIRQVLGASDFNVIKLLSNHLLLLVCIAAVPSTVLSYYAMNSWMQKFAYHTDISVLTFIVATILVLLVALATVALQSLKTARSNPVDALRYE